MKETIPFVKEVVFKDKISAITSISLEHQEKINEGEISGEFIVFGDYKIHADTTEKELFKYRLPYTAIIPNNIDQNTVKVDIEDFTYDIVDDTIMKVNIDYSIEGEETKEEKIIKEVSLEERDIQKNIKEVLPAFIIPTEDKQEEIQIDEVVEEKQEKLIEEKDINNDFITYYIHIVKENESIEEIIKKYETTIDNIKIYNDISNINIGDKIIIPKPNE